MAFDRRLKTLGSRCFRLMLFLLSKSDRLMLFLLLVDVVPPWLMLFLLSKSASVNWTILLEITEIVKASLILFLVSLVSQ